jgi:phosphatidylethanolamine-binding protein (PEBP) family uncharacterized protein
MQNATGRRVGDASELQRVYIDGTDTHRYFFKVYALDAILDISSNSTKSDLENAMKEHILAEGHIIGLYQRR